MLTKKELSEPIQAIDPSRFIDNMDQEKTYANNLAGLSQFMLDNGMIEKGELNYSDGEDKASMIVALKEIFGDELVNSMLEFLGE